MMSNQIKSGRMKSDTRARRAFLMAACAGLLFADGPLQAQSVTAAVPVAQGDSLDGTQLICAPAFSQSPEMAAMREGMLRPDPNFKMLLPPGGFEGEEFKKIMSSLREKQASDWPDLCHYRQANVALLAAGKHPDMVLIGDSITENWVAAHPDFFARGFVGRGISGQTSPQMLARFYADVVSLKPRVVQIMAGTNDIGGNTGPTLLSDYANTINSMIDIASANGISVILAKIPPITRIPTKPSFDPRPNVIRLNAKLEEIARQRGLVLVDYYGPLVDSESGFDRRYANEGVHPNRDGYAIMEVRLRVAYQAALERRR